MIRSSALALLGAMAFTSAAQVHAPADLAPLPAYVSLEEPTVQELREKSTETLAVYYTPLTSTAAAERAGFGMAYHMGIVYTDRSGRSFGVTAIPSDLKTPQTPKNMFTALLDMATDMPSTFGTLVSDRGNNTPFVKGSTADFYTKDSQGHQYPHSLVMRGRNLSAQWGTIVTTYARIGHLGLTYSPMTQNSNSLAANALRRAGIGLDFSSSTYFTPGAFTQLP